MKRSCASVKVYLVDRAPFFLRVGADCIVRALLLIDSSEEDSGAGEDMAVEVDLAERWRTL